MGITSNAWPVNELGEIVVESGVGTNNVTGFINQDQIPVAQGGIKLAGVAKIATDAAGNEVFAAHGAFAPGSVGRVESRTFSVNPAAPSTLVYVGQRLEMRWNTTQPLNAGGWVSVREDVLTFPQAATLDKAVLHLEQVNITANCTIDKLLVHEVEIAAITAGSTVNNFAGHYFPNLSGVSNINRITNFYAYANDEPRAMHKSAGPYVNAAIVEVAPPYHPGLVTGRYYSAPHDTVAANAVSPNIIYFVPVYVPHRATVTKVGFTVTASGAGNARLAIYRAKNGVPEILQVDAGTISVGTTGDKEITISQQLDSGTYYLAVNFSVACSVNWHQGSQALRQGMFGSSTSSLSGAAQECGGYFAYAFGAFPNVAGVMSYNPQQAEPHVWFRV